MKQILEWIDLANKSLFQPLKIHVTLWLFENSFVKVEGKLVQRRRSLPIESAYLQAFPDIYKRLIGFIKSKMFRERSEVRLGLNF